jgi:hypothetical protein
LFAATFTKPELMSTLENKYAALISAAHASGATNMAVRAQDNVLYIDGEVPTGEAKDKLWTVYNSIDPDFRSGDLILNLSVSPAAPSTQLKVTTEHSNLNIRKGPGTDQPIIGKAAHHSGHAAERNNDEWALIRSAAVRNYCRKVFDQMSGRVRSRLREAGTAFHHREHKVEMRKAFPRLVAV